MDKNSYILGLSFGYHDSAAAIIQNGKVVCAVEEERFTGKKHDNSFPTNSIKWVCEYLNISLTDIPVVCYYEDPSLKRSRIKSFAWKYFFKSPLQSLSAIFSREESIEVLLKEKLHEDIKVVLGNHHLSHQAYSYLTSDFTDSAIITVDGVGEYETITMSKGEGNILKPIQSVKYPHSLGMLYSSFTSFLGFKPNEGEYKVMGLAPYGNHERYIDELKKLYTLKYDGSFELNMDYFTYHYSDTEMFNTKLSELFGLPNRLPEEELTQEHKDLAAGLQFIYEYLFFRLLNRLYEQTECKNLCIGGGCAYNGTANGKIKSNTQFQNVWIPPAPSDAGSAIGCALGWFHATFPHEERKENKTPFLGPEQTAEEINKELQMWDFKVDYELIVDNKLIPKVAQLISEGNIIGWVDGRLEFGARALGNRSILADPRDPQMKKRVNMVVKKREGFRPFAPMVCGDEKQNYFTPPIDIPYMNQIVHVKDRHVDSLPAITHVDGSSRVQTLYQSFNKRMYRLLKQYKEITGYPILLNTSFNLKDQTMVRDTREALQTFMSCDMDYLVVGNFLVSKKIF